MDGRLVTQHTLLHRNRHFNMLRIAGSPVSRNRARRAPLRTFHENPNYPECGAGNQTFIDTVQAYYVDNGDASDSPATDSLLVYVHLHSDSDKFGSNGPLQPAFRDKASIFCALG